jgi:alkane 1-monooxygenase
MTVPLVACLVIPFADKLLGVNKRNLNADETKELKEKLFYKLITWLWLPMQLALLAYGLLWVLQPTRTLWDFAGMSFAVGIITGALGIPCSHELIHKPGRFEQALGLALMMSVSYPHYCIEHVWGHHKRVATPEDPTTARLGESFYSFYLRSVTGGLISAWQIEKRRRSGKVLENRILHFGIILAGIYALIYGTTGWRGLCFFLMQGFVAFSILELTHYVEHYGLLRRQIEPGKYERVQAIHSWNDGHWLSNFFTFNLGRHSSHHFLASWPFQLLQFHENAPQLPYSLNAMLLIALVPPLWFTIMDPLAKQWREESLVA